MSPCSLSHVTAALDLDAAGKIALDCESAAAAFDMEPAAINVTAPLDSTTFDWGQIDRARFID